MRSAGADLGDLAVAMDAVLIDAPCTGTGSWRRRPDAKWRLSERALAQRIAEQDALLAGAARTLKPGGRLVYVTCSLLDDENGARIAAFLAGNDAFRVLPAAEAIAAAALPSEFIAASYSGEHGMLLTPRKTGTDGFFVAVMRRT